MWGAPNALETMRVRLLSGRWLTAADALAEDQRVLINESFARTTWPGQEATGKRFRIGEGDNPEDWHTVVGVVGDIKLFGLTSEMGKKQAFYPISVNSPSAFLVIRTPGDPLAVADSVRRAVWNLEPDAPITELAAVSERLGETIALPRFNALMMLLLAASAIGLALIGVYGVLSYTVADRTRELGLRMALGAKRPDVVRMVARQGAVLVGIGALTGLGGALALSRAVSSQLYGVTPTDPGTFATTAVVLVMVGLVASSLPALRATRVDPMEALRNE